MLGVSSYFGEPVKTWLYPVQCIKSITQTVGTLSSLGLCPMGKDKTAVIIRSINP